MQRLGGNIYCLVIVDDYSRYTWTFFLEDKSKTVGIFKIFVEQEGEGINRYLVARLHGTPKQVEARHDCTALFPEDEAHPAAEAGLRVANGGQSSDERREIFRSQVESTRQHTTQG